MGSFCWEVIIDITTQVPELDNASVGIYLLLSYKFY